MLPFPRRQPNTRGDRRPPPNGCGHRLDRDSLLVSSISFRNRGGHRVFLFRCSFYFLFVSNHEDECWNLGSNLFVHGPYCIHLTLRFFLLFLLSRKTQFKSENRECLNKCVWFFKVLKSSDYFVYRQVFFPMARQPLGGLGRLIFRAFTITHFFRHATLGRTSLYEGPARRRDLYLTTHNTHKRQTSMP
jgi:hypothetical protein